MFLRASIWPAQMPPSNAFDSSSVESTKALQAANRPPAVGDCAWAAPNGTELISAITMSAPQRRAVISSSSFRRPSAWTVNAAPCGATCTVAPTMGAAFPMDFDLVLRDVRLADARPGEPSTDIGVKIGRIAAIAPRLGGGAREEVQGGGRLVSAGFVETHIHLDKSCILARCESEAHRHPHRAMERVSAVKHTFTVEDVTERAAGTIEKCISHGATRMRTHVEVDPKVGLRGLEGVKALIDRYAWAIDLEICVMPQEGLTNNPGTDELMVAALKAGATVVGAAPNYDTDRPAQIAASSRWRASSTSTSTCIWIQAPRPRSSSLCWSPIPPRSTAGAAASPSAM